MKDQAGNAAVLPKECGTAMPARRQPCARIGQGARVGQGEEGCALAG